MSNEAIFQYLNRVREEYKKSNRTEKSVILGHAMLVTGLSRKRIIRLLGAHGGPTRLMAASKPGRKPKYGDPRLLAPLKTLWFLMEQPCGKRLKALIPRLLPGYRKRNPEFPDDLAQLLSSMSPATIDRLLKVIKTQKGVSTTKAPTSSWYKTAIPVAPKDWNITAPGYAQADTVSHCGEDASGAFASTLTLTDIDSHWTEMRATFTKQHTGIIQAIRDIEKQLPFVLHTIKFDSGSEFMNYAVVSYCRGSGESYSREKPLQVLRSRPYPQKRQLLCRAEKPNARPSFHRLRQY